MKLKHKFWAGLLAISGMSAAVIVLAVWLLTDLKQHNSGLLQENFRSITYAGKIQQQLAGYAAQPTPRAQAAVAALLDSLIRLQEQNITESGEDILTAQLRSSFAELRGGNPQAASQVQLLAAQIQHINEQALLRKNQAALARADLAWKWMAAGASLFFILIFTLLYNIPSAVLGPVQRLRTGIIDMAKGDFSQRIFPVRTDELGDVQAAFNQLAEELAQWRASNTASLVAEQHRLEAVLDASPDALFLLDERHTLTRINDLGCLVLGLARPDCLGKNAMQLASENELFARLLDRMERPQQQPLSIVLDGKERYFDMQVSLVQAAGWLLLLQDVTGHKELDLAKNSFLATVSHELKTPIASLKLSAKLLQDDRVGQLNPEQQKILASLADDTDRLNALASHLLQLARLESGHIPLEFAQHPVRLPADLACQALHTQADDRKVILEIEEQVPGAVLRFDLEKTTWVLTNLISNAIRYSPAGQKVRICIAPKEDRLEYQVTDSGPGIPLEHQARLFDRFYTVPGQQFGSGLGLSIARQFLQAQGGGISVNSHPGQGSVFTAWLSSNL